MRWIFRIFVGGGLLVLLLPVVAVLIYRIVPPPVTPLMLWRAWQGQPIHQIWRSLPELSPQIMKAVVAAEDSRFCLHHGFDWDAIARDMEENERGGRLRGASTISQQTAKNLFLWNGRSFVRKGLEAYFTVLIEFTWPKQRILEVYVNIAELGDGIYGVGAASDAYFHTSPARLGPAQAARLAAVLPSPRRLHVDRPSAYVQRRANWIQQQMNQLGGPGYIEGRAPPRPRR